MLSSFNKKYPEAFFIIKLLLLFSIFYFGTQFWIGITSKGNYYNAFCDNHLNYINWLRTSILKCSAFICSIFGYTTTVENTISLRVIDGYKVNMVYSCLGIGILSSWAAFAIAFPTKIKRKIIWLLGGLLIIWFANSVRITVLLILLNKTRNPKGFANHHTVFNLIAYSIVLLLIYFYTKEKSATTNIE